MIGDVRAVVLGSCSRPVVGLTDRRHSCERAQLRRWADGDGLARLAVRAKIVMAARARRGVRAVGRRAGVATTMLATGKPIGSPLTDHTDAVGAVATAQLDGRIVVISGSRATRCGWGTWPPEPGDKPAVSPGLPWFRQAIAETGETG